MVSMLASSAVDRGFEFRSGQTKDYNIGICCFFSKHTALKGKNKDWLAWNQNNVSEWVDMSTRGIRFSQLTGTGYFSIFPFEMPISIFSDHLLLTVFATWFSTSGPLSEVLNFKGHFALITTQMRTEDHFTLATIANCGRRVIQTRLLHCGFRGIYE